MGLLSNQLNQLKGKLEETIQNANRKKAQEEYLLQQLKETFECDTVEEGIELLEVFLSEKKINDEKIKVKTDKLLNKMKEEGLL